MELFPLCHNGYIVQFLLSLNQTNMGDFHPSISNTTVGICIQHFPETAAPRTNKKARKVIIAHYLHSADSVPRSTVPPRFLERTIEIIGIECVLLPFLSKNFVSTKWRIYKGILASPRLLRREFRAVARSAIVFLSNKVYRKIKIPDFTWKNGS